MILFQIGDINLYKEIKDLKVSLNENQAKFSIDSSYIYGERRAKKTGTKKFSYKVTGLLKSQHVEHYLRALSERDEGRAEIKCFFTEKYTVLDDIYQNKTDKAKIKFFFAYCYLDIEAINPIKLGSKIEYDILFNVDIDSDSVYDITYQRNCFLIDTLKSDYIQANRYDAGLRYDTGLRYDNFLQNLTNLNQTLSKYDKLFELYDKLTCCDENSYFLLTYFDWIIKPFIYDNIYFSSGIINNTINNQNFVFKDEQRNFLQIYLSNPVLSTTSLASSYSNFVNVGSIANNITEKQEFLLHYLDLHTNTFTKNGIIQIFRNNFGFDSINSNGWVPYNAGLNGFLFEELNQTIKITVKNAKNQINSSLAITCKSTFIKDNLKMLIIHPHRQKVYGFFDAIDVAWNSNFFFFDTVGFNLIDLEPYLISGDLIIENESYKNQDWLRFSPTYGSNNYNSNVQDIIQLENRLSNVNQQTASGTAIICQIYSLHENKLL
jgi:hypothetical protein